MSVPTRYRAWFALLIVGQLPWLFGELHHLFIYNAACAGFLIGAWFAAEVFAR